MNDLISTIEAAYAQRESLRADDFDPILKTAILTAISLLNTGKARVAEKNHTGWIVNEWLKKAVLLYFRMQPNQMHDGAHPPFYDKVPMKFAGMSEANLQESGVRIVPPASIRYGAYVAPNTVVMPSFINIGAYVDTGTMIDTWATVGSCAQIGKNVHLSGGVGIGGVLEPLQARPTIIEDNCFIGARSEVAEGVIVEAGSVLSMGVYLGQSTPIYNRLTGETIYGRVPTGSVVVPGTRPSQTGECALYCAVIVKQVDAQTRAKTSLNDLLRLDNK